MVARSKRKGAAQGEGTNDSVNPDKKKTGTMGEKKKMPKKNQKERGLVEHFCKKQKAKKERKCWEKGVERQAGQEGGGNDGR